MRMKLKKGERNAKSAIPQMNIKALEGTKMIPGKVYRVSEIAGEALIKNKRAIKATPDEEVGNAYDYPKPKGGKPKSDITD